MRIFLVNQFFWPDGAPTAEYAADVADGLAARGHDVVVICGRAGYRMASERAKPNVRTVRVPVWSFGKDRWRRGISYVSFFLSAFAAILLLVRRSDCLLTMSTPPFLPVLGRAAQALWGARHCCWEMDAYPETAFALGAFSRTCLLGRFAAKVALEVRRSADRVIVLGECMRRRLVSSGVPPERIHVVENWADPQQIRATAVRNNPVLRLLYSGNLGRAHDLDTVLDALANPRLDPNVRLVMATPEEQRPERLGRWDKLRERVEFRPLQPSSKLSESLSECELGLVTLRPDCEGVLVPSKLYGLLAAGRPILFVGPVGASPAVRLREYSCGWTIANGDSIALVDLLNALVADRKLLHSAGARARQAFELYHTRAAGVAAICELVAEAERGLSQDVACQEA